MPKKQNKDQTIAELRAEIETLKNIIYLMPGNVYWKNRESVYLGCNNNLAKTLKLNSPEEIIGKSQIDIIGADSNRIISKIDQTVIETKKEIRIEEHGFDINNEPAIYITQKSPLYDNKKKVIGLLGISLDITKRIEAEEKLKIAKQKAEAANRAKSQFLAMVSHELRTPLASILGFANFLAHNKLTNKEKIAYTQHIIYSGSYLLSLISNILDYSRLENKKIKPELMPLNLKKLTEDIINMLNGSAKLKNLTLHLEYEKNTPEYVISDSRILQQILINLLGNAIKFTEKGYVKLKISCLNNIQEHAELQLAVEDTGVGIPAHEQKSIFKQFHQLDNIYTRKASLTGTGLGLAIVKKLTKQLHGKIKLHSIPHKGSTFYFIAPFQKITTTELNSSSSLQDKLKLAGEKWQQQSIENTVKNTFPRKLHALLIEDDILIQTIHKKILKELGCRVTVAKSSSEALALLGKNFDILFVDIGLPDLNGFELIKIIRSTLGYQTPIIALTGFSETEERNQCLDAGANEVAIKPVSNNDLGELICHHVKQTR